ncbi:MAG: alpha-amylase family glycosyl hydrolase [Spirosomaceae bacterium]|nr:alpha-amylase family glycosyl hydrolase [Spirosomataceae bacterium]
MKRFYYLLWLMGVWAQSALGQALTIKPEFPSPDKEVTLTFDLTQAKDNRKVGLLNQMSGLYVWAWGGSDPNNKTAEFGPMGQTSFSQAFAPGLLTRVSENVWSIKLIPQNYLTVTGGKTLRWMGVLVKNANGSAQTEDFLFDLYPANQLIVRFETPTARNFYVDANSTLSVRAKASARASLTLTLDGTTVATATDTVLRATVPVGATPNQRRTLRISATANNQTVTDSLSFIISPTPRVAAVPAGARHGINYTSPTSATLVLFAPQKKFVHLLGDFNDWEARPDYLMNVAPDGQTYWLTLNNLVAQKEYAFQYLVEGTVAVGDPYCEKILDRNNDRFIPASTYPNLMPFPTKAQGSIVSVLQTAQTPYPWKVNNFKRPANEDLVIYELHVRDFVGTQAYKTVTDSLPYLKRLGVNAIELMPIMEFSGNDSWGYNPIYYTAPDKAYGTPNDLKAFIDRCHELGIAVLLDMVLNQADFEFPYVKMYWDGTMPAANSPMFNQSATHPFSVFFDFNHEAPATQAYVQRVNDFWLKEYRFDGYRFDLSKGFTQVNSGNDVARWGRYDASRVAIWKRIYDQIRRTDPTAIVILEHFADDNEEAELMNYGMLTWGNENGAFRESIKNGKGNFFRLSWKNRGLPKPASIGYMESHDEERLVYDALTNGGAGKDYLVKTLPNALERAKALASLFFLVPGPKMIWQFGELGYDVSINENGRTGRKPIRWEYQRDPNRLKLYKTYAELIKLKTSQAAFRSSEFTLDVATEIKRIALTHPSMNVQVVANLGVEFQRLALPVGKWFDYFTGQEVNVANNDPQYSFAPGQFHVLTSTKLPTPERDLTPWSIQPVTSVEPLSVQVVVAPNPAREQLRVSWQNDHRGPVQIAIADMAGRTLTTQTAEKNTDFFAHEMAVEKLSSGTYFLQITEGEQRSTKKWVKQ